MLQVVLRRRHLSSLYPVVRRSAFATAAPSPSPRSPVLWEQRSYTLHPAGIKAWCQLTDEAAMLRKTLNPAFVGMFHTDTGGDLSTVTHFYAYENMLHRTRVRAALAKNLDWQRYIDAARPHVQRQESTLFLDCVAVREAAKLPPMANLIMPPIGRVRRAACFELRTYQLVLGYNPVPRMVEEFVKGIPAKLSAADYGQLIMVAASEVGDLNKVIELWRFDDAASCLQHREASRRQPAWKAAIGAIAPSVQSFNTTLLTPLACSPWQ